METFTVELKLYVGLISPNIVNCYYDLLSTGLYPLVYVKFSPFMS